MVQDDVPSKQRVLILQGGGSLGAYEAGIFKALHEKIPEEDKRKGEKGRPLFDIVAGTSIGAINAAILVSHVAEKNTWDESPQKLNEFWDYVSTDSYVDKIPGFIEWWNNWQNFKVF